MIFGTIHTGCLLLMCDVWFIFVHIICPLKMFIFIYMYLLSPLSLSSHISLATMPMDMKVMSPRAFQMGKICIHMISSHQHISFKQVLFYQLSSSATPTVWEVWKRLL